MSGLGNFFDLFAYDSPQQAEEARMELQKKRIEQANYLAAARAQSKLGLGVDPDTGQSYDAPQAPQTIINNTAAMGAPVDPGAQYAKQVDVPGIIGRNLLSKPEYAQQSQNLLRQAFPQQASASMEASAFPQPITLNKDQVILGPPGPDGKRPTIASNMVSEPKVVGQNLVDGETGKVIYSGPDPEAALHEWQIKNIKSEIDNRGKAQPAPQQPITLVENNLRDEFNKLTEPYRAINAAHGKIIAGASARDDKGEVGTPAGDMGMIFGYMKILDPTSTVREGEYATAEQATGVPGAVLQLYNKALTGQKLTPDQRKDFINRATDLVRSQKAFYDTTKTRYGEIAKRNGANPLNVVTDAPALAEAPALPPAGVPQTARQGKDAEGKLGWYTPDPSRPGKFIKWGQ